MHFTMYKNEVLNRMDLIEKMDDYEYFKLSWFNEFELINIQINTNGSVEVYE